MVIFDEPYMIYNFAALNNKIQLLINLWVKQYEMENNLKFIKLYTHQIIRHLFDIQMCTIINLHTAITIITTSNS